MMDTLEIAYWAQYEVSIAETHHTQKLDTPSGTAIRIAELILKSNSLKEKWVSGGSGSPDELSILSNRIENVPGTHTVLWDSKADTIGFTHIAHSREGFAEGALS